MIAATDKRRMEIFMAEIFKVSLQKIIDEFKLESIFLPKDANDILIGENEVNRPGLQLMDFMNILTRRESR